MKIPNVPNTSVKLMLFPFSLEGAARIWLEKEPPRSIETWDDLVSKFINKFFPPSKTTNLRNEITRFQQKFDETFYEAWDRFNDLLRGCPHHGFSELHQLDTFYNALNSNDQDSLNSAAGGPAPQHGVSRTDFERYVTANDAVLRNMQNQGQNLQSQMANLTDMLSKFVTANTASTSGSGTLPGNTVTNPKEDLKGITTRSGVTIQGPKAVNHDTEVTKDTMPPANNGSTEDVQPPVVQIQTRNPNPEPNVAPVIPPVPKASIPFPSRRNDEKRKEKANDQIEKFYEIFRDLSFEIRLLPRLEKAAKSSNSVKLKPLNLPLMNLPEIEKAALLKVLKSHQAAIAWKLSDIKGVSPEFCTHKILMEEDYEPSVQSQRRVNPKIHDVIKKEVEKLLDAGLIYPISDSPWVSPVHCVPKKGGMTVITNEENELIPTRLVTGWRVCIDYRKLNEATRKDHFPLPFMDQMLERLAGNEYYCFLDGFSGYFQIPIDPKDQEKTTFTCPYGTFAYRRMPFGLCNAPGTFQRCMMAIFHDMIEKTMEVFMDDFSVFGRTFLHCLTH
ncbi:reverse transcriptase domain-containing protein [Tanacetum coccineum]